ncbi:hypothetical protein DPK65_20660 [Salmonella enterica subsp. enterica]|nr:hypothetical protein [Salmonella enterica subsp. enterica]ECJ4521155.1 hypothetical protein [Salmonella enterica subsp. enterica]
MKEQFLIKYNFLKVNLAGGINLYLYGHNPLGWVDPLGLEVYELRAGKDGTYDVYEWGNPNPVGQVDLKKGDVWKIGETSNHRTRTDGTTVQNRYPQVFLDDNDLEYHKVDDKGSKAADRINETGRIDDYRKKHNGELPPGNKCRH